jgi:Uma2 family endonuclease
MTFVTETKMKWTSADLVLLPDTINRYEIIQGELEMTRAPHWLHQKTILKISTSLDNWSVKTKLGTVIINPGIIFSDADNIIPDLVWISNERLAVSIDDAGHLTNAPELIVEVLSDGFDNIRRDRETKLKLYSNCGVQEYWIADWRLKQLEIYQRNQGKLELVKTLLINDDLTTPLLPEFSCSLSQIFS